MTNGAEPPKRPRVTSLRHAFLRHRRLAALLLALALCLKALVPVGFMIGPSETATLTIRLCDSQNPGLARLEIPLKRHSPGESHSDEATHCPYTALAFGTLGSIDPWLLAGALAFALLLGLSPLVALRLPRIEHEAPPLRGPPVHA